MSEEAEFEVFVVPKMDYITGTYVGVWVEITSNKQDVIRAISEALGINKDKQYLILRTRGFEPIAFSSIPDISSLCEILEFVDDGYSLEVQWARFKLTGVWTNLKRKLECSTYGSWLEAAENYALSLYGETIELAENSFYLEFNFQSLAEDLESDHHFIEADGVVYYFYEAR